MGGGGAPATNASERRAMAEEYIASLRNNSGLHVMIADQVAKAYDKKTEYGIFSSFLRPCSRSDFGSGLRTF